jgi:hypothetical protein
MSFLKQLDGMHQNALGRLSRILLASDGTLPDTVEAAIGQTSGRNFVYAESFLALDRFPAAFGRALTELDTPIGRLWAEHRLEGRKELLEASCAPASPRLAAYFPASADLVMRRYRMISGGKPVMLIAEYFPAHFPELSARDVAETDAPRHGVQRPY